MAISRTDHIHYPILTNGLDFILEGLKLLSGVPNPKDIKYAILHVSAGIEVVLKERLIQEDWRLVFEDMSEADLTDYNNGDFSSVYYNTCIERLKNDCGVSISSGMKKRIGRLRKLRNQIEHFGVSVSANTALSITAKAMTDLVDFVNRECNTTEETDIEMIKEIRSLLGSFQTYRVEKWQRIKKEVDDSATAVVTCPGCDESAAVTGEGANCKFCGYRADTEEAANEYISSVMGLKSHYRVVKQGGVWPLQHCPECCEDALIQEGDSSFCFSCGITFNAVCSRCQEPMNAPVDEIPVCSDCWATIMAD